jgi:hypothetical protein
MYYLNFKNLLFFILVLFSVMRIKINTNKEFWIYTKVKDKLPQK